MDVAAKVTSKGQVTVPKAVRDALGIQEGDQLIFRVEGNTAVVTRTPSLMELAGSVPVPPGLEGASWEEIRRTMREKRYGNRG